MQASVPAVYCWKSDVFVASFPSCISRYNIFPNLEHTSSFNSAPNGSVFLDIKNYFGRSLLGVVQKNMEIIDSSPVFYNPGEIFLHYLLNL